MDSTNNPLEQTMRRARVRYEWTRARRAALGFLPVFVLVAVACALGERPWWSLTFGLSLFAAGVVALSYGRDARRAVLPGLAAGGAPLVLVLLARHVDHVCGGPECTSLCLQACLVGGAIAGLVVGFSKASGRAGAAFWVAASFVAVLTGAMACARLGLSGILGLVFGYVVGLVPGLVRRVRS